MLMHSGLQRTHIPKRLFAEPSTVLCAIAALSVFALALFAPQILNDGDTYWHLAAGERMLAERQVLRTDPFSFTRFGAAWHAHEWLSEILMAAAFRAAGWSGVTLLFAGAAGLATALLARHLSRWLDPLPCLIALTLAIGMLAPSFLARPHLLTLPLLELWTAGLLIARAESRAPRYALLPLMALWANLHGSFVLGLALIAPFALEAAIEAKWQTRALKPWALFGCGAVIAALLTPHGVEGLLFPFKLMGMSSLALIAEWRATDFSRLQPLEIALLAALFIFLTRGVRFPAIRLVVLLGLLHMALAHGRHHMVLAFVGTLIVAATVGGAFRQEASNAVEWRATRRLWSFAAIALAATLALARLAVPVERRDGPESPISALAQVPEDLRRRPVFNEYGFGGYLIHCGINTFIDGRTDLFGDQLVSEYTRITHPDAGAFDQAVREFGIAWTILSPSNPLVTLLDLRPGWRRLYTDSFAVVHVTDQEPHETARESERAAACAAARIE